MWQELEARGKRYLELKALLEQSDTVGRTDYAALLKEFGRLGSLGERYTEYASAMQQVEEAQELLKDADSDEELKALAKDQLAENQARAEEIKNQLVEEAASGDLDEDANRNVIMELYAGTGGDEAALFVADLFEMYKRFIQDRGWKLTVLDSSDSEHGGLSKCTFRVEGNGAFGSLQFEGGGHRVQRVPKTESQGRIHTSMARVAVMPEAEEVDIEIDPDEVEIKFCGAGGPGGQNVNKVATQCQLHHLPSGITVHCMETRSQKTNKERAFQILRSKLFAIEKEKKDRERGNMRMGQLGTGDRGERVRTYNFPQGRCTDHRLEGEDKNFALQSIMIGQIDPILEKLKAVRKRDALASS